MRLSITLILIFGAHFFVFAQQDLKSLYDLAQSTSDLELAKKVNLEAAKIKNKKLQAHSYYLIAYLHKKDEHFYEAVSSFYEAQLIYRDLQDYKQAAHVIENIAEIYHLTGFYDTALKYYYEAVDLHGSAIDATTLIRLNAGIAVQLQELNRIDESLKQFQNTILLAETANNTYWLYRSYNNMGRLHRLSENYSLAEASYQKALTYANSANDKAQIFNNLGYLLLNLKDTVSAHSYLNRGLKLLTENEINNEVFTGLIYSNLADIYDARHLDSALWFYERSYELFKNNRLVKSAEYFAVCKKLKAVSRESGDLKAAFAYSDDIDQLTAELLELRAHLSDLHNRYQVEAATFKFYHQEKAKALEKQLLIDRYITIALIILVIMLGAMLVVLYNKNRKINFARDTARKIYQVIHS